MVNKLSRRLILWVIITSFSLSLFWTVLQVWRSFTDLENLFEQEVQSALLTFCPQLEQAISNMNSQQVNQILDSAAVLMSIKKAELVVNQQRVAKELSNQNYNKTKEFSFFSFAEKKYSCVLDVKDKPKLELVLTTNSQTLEQWAQNALNMRILLGLLHALILALLLSLIYRHILTYPLASLLRYIKSIDPRKPKERLPQVLKKHRKDELGEWVARVNQLLDEIADFQQSITDQSKRLDPLTGLLNLQELCACLKKSLQHASDSESYAVFYIGLEHFKQINERYGYRVADKLLYESAQRLKILEDEASLLSRVSSSFCLVKRIDIKDDVEHIVQTIEKIFARPFIFGDSINLRVKIGIALFPDDDKGVAALLRKAELAMTLVRDHTDALYQYYDAQDDAQLRYQRNIEEALWGASRRGELCLRYQLKKDLRTGRYYGVEALVRWNHPVLGSITPDVFIPIAERIGAIRSITFWVAVEAVQQARLWQAAGLENFSVAINLSGSLANTPQLPDIIKEEITRLDVDARLIEIELTESSFLHDITMVNANLLKLRELSIKLSIDDFGTGYSSLSYLQQLPVDVVKLDQSFIRALPSTYNENLLRILVQLLHTLGLQALCEGVETLEQEAFLKSIDCDYAQGYLYSEPLEAEQITQLMLAINNKADE
ncbi:EAL domain-containing protein [Pseudomonas sp. F1_0610]|uniref:putative bifunctional diguanylate cyclase/phosphodiesterase n=1 Tax=Pseudomonas sp. F1_0610 TaxID=3114284 RepID=UPI0039C4466C